MHLKSISNNDLLDNPCFSTTIMASSSLNDEEDNATRNTQQQKQQQQQQQNNNNIQCSHQQKKLIECSTNTTANSSTNKMQENEAKLKKQNLEQRKLELEKLLNEKSWLLQQLQKQETEILQGNFEYMNFNDFIQNLAVQYKQEQPRELPNTTSPSGGTGTGSLAGIPTGQLTAGEEAILRRKPLTAKENHQNNNLLHRRQSEISNRSSEYDNYPQHDNHSTHSEGGRAVMQGAAQATQQYATKAALKKRSATVAGTTAQSSTNLQIIRQQHLEQQQQQQQQQLLYKQQQQQLQLQQQQQHNLYHQAHPQQHLFKQHLEHHQVLMPHLQYATQKFYYTTLQPQQQLQTTQQQQYGRYIQNKQIAQQQTLSPSQQQQQHFLQTSPQQQSSQSQHQQLLLTPTSSVAGQLITMDNISLYSLNSNNVATLHRPAQQQQPIIVQCDKYYLSPTSHHVSHNDGAGFIKSSQNIKEYISPLNSPQHLTQRDKSRTQTSQTNLTQRGVTPSLDAISLAPSYMSMETIDYAISPSTQQATNMRWRSQTNLPPIQNMQATGQEMKSQSQDMLNNNQYYNSALNPPPPPSTSINNNNNQGLPPQVTQVKPFKPLDDISVQSFSTEAQKKLKPKQWLESSLDGPVIRQTPLAHNEELISSPSSSSTNTFQRAKLSSQSLNTARHYSMSAAQSKALHNQNASNVSNNIKLSQSTSYLNQMEQIPPTPSISQAYNLELSPQTPTAYKYLPNTAQQQQPPARPPPSALIINTTNFLNTRSSTTTPPVASAAALSPDIRIESPVNMTIVQPATFQPYKEVTKPFEMSDFYKYSTKFRQKETNSNNNNNPEN